MNLTLDPSRAAVQGYASGPNTQHPQSRINPFEITIRITAVVFLVAAGVVFLGVIPVAANSKLLVSSALVLASALPFVLSIFHSKNVSTQSVPLPVPQPPPAPPLPTVHPTVAEYRRVKCSTAPGALRAFIQNQLNGEPCIEAFGKSLTEADIDYLFPRVTIFHPLSTDTDDPFDVRGFVRRDNPETNLFGRLIIYLDDSALSTLVDRIYRQYLYTGSMQDFVCITSALFVNDSAAISQKLSQKVIFAARRLLGIVNPGAFITRYLNNVRVTRMPRQVRSFLLRCALYSVTEDSDVQALGRIVQHQHFCQFCVGLEQDTSLRVIHLLLNDSRNS